MRSIIPNQPSNVTPQPGDPDGTTLEAQSADTASPYAGIDSPFIAQHWRTLEQAFDAVCDFIATTPEHERAEECGEETEALTADEMARHVAGMAAHARDQKNSPIEAHAIPLIDEVLVRYGADTDVRGSVGLRIAFLEGWVWEAFTPDQAEPVALALLAMDAQQCGEKDDAERWIELARAAKRGAAATARPTSADTLLVNLNPAAAAELVARTRGPAYEALRAAVNLFIADESVTEESRERAKNLWFDLVSCDEASLTVRRLRSNELTVSALVAALKGDIAEADEYFRRAELAAQQ